MAGNKFGRTVKLIGGLSTRGACKAQIGTSSTIDRVYLRGHGLALDIASRTESYLIPAIALASSNLLAFA